MNARRNLVFLVLSFAVLASTARAADAPAPVIPADKGAFHIFVLMGQSNMAGSAMPILAEYVEPATDVLMLGRDLAWSGAKTPRGQGMCPGQSFAHHYAALHPGVTVGLIQCARGARSLKELSKGGKDRDGSPNYDNSLARIKEAMKRGTLKGVLWHQGESDCGDPNYVKRLAALVADLRADTGVADLPFIAGELGRFAAWTAAFNKLIPTAAQSIPRCAVAGSQGLLDLGDKVHFSGFSAEVLGARYLMEYLRMVEPEAAPKFKPVLETITAKMLAREAAWDVLLNGDMSEGGARPFAWDGWWLGRGTLEVVHDERIFASAPAAMRLASVGGPAQGSVAQTLRNVAGRRLRVSLKIKNDGFSACQISLYGVDGSWKQVYEKTLINAPSAPDWTPFTAEADVPANAVNTRLAIVVQGRGAAYIDDVVIQRIGNAQTATTSTGANLLTNGSMTDGEAVPSGWTGTWTAKGKIKATRDTKTFKNGPASLRLESDGGPVNGSAGQELKGAAGKTIKVTGWAKADGRHQTSVAVVSFDAKWKVLRWEPVFVAPRGPDDWTAFDKTVDVPAGAARVNLTVGIDGEGSAWFDELGAAAVGGR
jgi:hypothetical protein